MREGKKLRSGSRTHLQFVPQLAERLSLTVPCDGTRWYWTSLVDSPVLLQRCPVPSHGTVSPPFWTVPRSLLLPRHGGRQQVPASQRTAPTPPLPLTAATPPRPRSTAASPLSHLSFYCSSTTRLGQLLAVSASFCCSISSAPRFPSAARDL